MRRHGKMDPTASRQQRLTWSVKGHAGDRPPTERRATNMWARRLLIGSGLAVASMIAVPLVPGPPRVWVHDRCQRAGRSVTPPSRPGDIGSAAEPAAAYTARQPAPAYTSPAPAHDHQPSLHRGGCRRHGRGRASVRSWPAAFSCAAAASFPPDPRVPSRRPDPDWSGATTMTGVRYSHDRGSIARR